MDWKRALGRPATPAAPAEKDAGEAVLTKKRTDQIVQRHAMMAAMVRPTQFVRNKKGEVEAVGGVPRAPDKRNHLTLVELPYRLQTSRLPRPAWEPFSYLYKESVHFGFERVTGYLETLLKVGNSVEGWKGSLLVQGMQGDRGQPDKPGGGLTSSGGKP